MHIVDFLLLGYASGSLPNNLLLLKNLFQFGAKFGWNLLIELLIPDRSRKHLNGIDPLCKQRDYIKGGLKIVFFFSKFNREPYRKYVDS